METVLNRNIVENRMAGKAIWISFFLSATVLGAFVRIPLPFTPVPVTFQTFFVLLAGACLPPGAAGLSQLLYVALAAAGAPVLAGAAGGLAAVSGPTGGYLFGFAAAAFLVGSLKRFFDGSFAATLALFLLASALILAAGSLWLMVVLNVPPGTAFGLGFAPFIAGDALKSCAASLVYRRLRSRAL